MEDVTARVLAALLASPFDAVDSAVEVGDDLLLKKATVGDGDAADIGGGGAEAAEEEAGACEQALRQCTGCQDELNQGWRWTTSSACDFAEL